MNDLQAFSSNEGLRGRNVSPAVEVHLPSMLGAAEKDKTHAHTRTSAYASISQFMEESAHTESEKTPESWETLRVSVKQIWQGRRGMVREAVGEKRRKERGAAAAQNSVEACQPRLHIEALQMSFAHMRARARTHARPGPISQTKV